MSEHYVHLTSIGIFVDTHPQYFKSRGVVIQRQTRAKIKKMLP